MCTPRLRGGCTGVRYPTARARDERPRSRPFGATTGLAWPRAPLVVSCLTARVRRGCLLGALREAVAECVQHQLQTIRQIQLIENRGDVVAHRRFADEQPFADLAIAQTFSDAADDLVLAPGQRRHF